METASLLIVDDDPLVVESLRHAFPGPAWKSDAAASAAGGLEIFSQRRPDVVLLDIGLPDISGLDAVKEFRQIDPKVPVIIVTGLGTSTAAIEAIRQGAFEYVEKPFQLEQLYAVVDRAVETSRLMRVPALLPEQSPPDDQGADVLIGRCPAMQDVYRAIGRVARQNAIVLILGESGTGKEVIARALYHYSDRADQPFLAINCAAIPETLLESELFGHERGSFTGADRRRIGKFEQCHGGTLFLDEIGDMTPLTQAKILRLLQDQTFERVGGTETIRTNVRLIAATNRDLRTLMERGQFREDLYYRLNVYTISLPPLRERDGDIVLLVQHFLKRFGREFDRETPRLAPETLDILERYPWPGNIRELQSVVKHALIDATGPVLVPENLPPQVRGEPANDRRQGMPPLADGELNRLIDSRIGANSQNLLMEVLESVERQVFAKAWRHTGGNITQTARLLGITRVTARAKLAAYGISSAADPPSTA